jgi:serine phosphatase RsbU (regulator of sigma subunit)
MKKALALIFFYCVHLSLFAQNAKVNDLSKFGKTPEERFINLRQLGYGAMQTQKFQDAYTYFKASIEQFEAIGTLKEKNATGANYAKLNNDFGYICDTLGRFNLRIMHTPTAVDYFRDAVKPYLYANNQKAVFNIQKLLAEHYLKENKPDRAVARYQSLLKLIRITDAEVISDAHYEMARIFAQKSDLDSAMATFQTAYTHLKGRKQIAVLYGKIFTFFKDYYEENQSQEAILDFAAQYFAEKIHKEGDPILQGALYIYKAQIELMRGKRGSFFKDITAGIEIFLRENDFSQTAKACILAANTHIDAEEYEKALTYLEEAKKASAQIQNNNKLAAEINGKIAEAERAVRLESAESKSLALDVQMENQRKLYRNVALGGLIILLIIAVVSFINKKKANSLLRKQNEEISRNKIEIEQQRDNIEQQKNQIENAYRNIRLMSEIGQKITATLDLDNVVKIVYDCFGTLVPTDRFAVAVYDEAEKKLNFIKFYENGNAVSMPPFKIEKNEESIFSKSILLKKEYLLNDLSKTAASSLFGENKLPISNKHAGSMICLPLLVEQKSVGLILVETLAPNAYSSKDLVLLRTLASYTSIALDNANAYSIIERKNHHITDSIRYAETIQNALLPENQVFSDSFGDYFVFFRPKDIVSGDFYWTFQNKKKTLVAVVDCTGHGVPGAFMSMIGITLLNDAVSVENLSNPPSILQHLHNGVRKALRQTAETGRANDDGMDVCLCAFEAFSEDSVKVSFAGAKRPLYHLAKPYLVAEEIRGDAKAIGGVQKEPVRTFALKEFIAYKGDCIYLTTDGFADQNNEEKQKFGTNRLKEMLLENAHKNMNTQKLLLTEALDKHSGFAEQRDDVTIIGLKI